MKDNFAVDDRGAAKEVCCSGNLPADLSIGSEYFQAGRSQSWKTFPMMRNELFRMSCVAFADHRCHLKKEI